MELNDAAWRKSSFSSNGHASCVEVADNLPNIIAVRDSKDPEGPKLIFSPSQWQAFVSSIRSGELVLP